MPPQPPGHVGEAQVVHGPEPLTHFDKVVVLKEGEQRHMRGVN